MARAATIRFRRLWDKDLMLALPCWVLSRVIEFHAIASNRRGCQITGISERLSDTADGVARICAARRRERTCQTVVRERSLKVKIRSFN